MQCLRFHVNTAVHWTGVTEGKKEKGVKLNLKSLFLSCLILFTLFAGSARAQEAQEEDNSTPDPELQKMLDGFKSVKPAPAAASTQQQVKGETVNPETSACTYTFTSGTGISYLQYCVTVNGNIVEFQSPVGVEQIKQGTVVEGYGVCDITDGDLAYYDYADGGASGNWNAPVLMTHSATEVKIQRTTSDGLWTLIQTITNLPGGNPAAKVTMGLKNNSTTPKQAFLFRYADIDPGNAAGADTNFKESFDATANAAWGWVPGANDVSSAPSYGLMFQRVGNPAPASVPFAIDGYGRNTNTVPAPCNPSAGYTSPINGIDGSIVYLWVLQNIAREQTVTVNGKYFAF